jgi:anti-anti-sigma factor
MICSAGEPELLVSALEYDRGGPCAVVSLSGQAGIADSGWIRPMLELHAAQGQGRLVIDLSRLSSMDWWVALILAWAGRVVTRRGGVLVLASPQPDVARMLNSAGASKVIEVTRRPSMSAAR